jgi:hypothetical protein
MALREEAEGAIKMNSALPSKAAMAMVLASILWSTVAFAQILARREFAVPPLVRFTGTLLPSNEKGDGGFHTLEVLVQNKKWLFRLDNVETLTAPYVDWMILNEIFPSELHFAGPEDLMSTLQISESEGKPVTVEGRLYISDGMFAVTGAEEVAENAG